MSLKFTRRDQNRFKRVYPYLRREPNYTLSGGEGNNLIYEAGKVSFSNETSVTYTFTETFPGVPSVVASVVDSLGNDLANINVYIENLTISSMIVSVSAPFTGEVHFHAVYEIT